MTKKPAETFNLAGRGELKAGACADITIFNPDTVIDRGTFTDPAQYPAGIEYVMVNGEYEVRKGVHTGVRNGAVLRKKASGAVELSVK